MFEGVHNGNPKLGTVYGILMTFENAGFVESRWELEEPAGRPKRKLYRLTKTGIKLFKAREFSSPD